MNIEQFRSDFLVRKAETGITQKSLSTTYGVEQGSLSRFISGKQGLSFDYVIALWPFVYGKDFPCAQGETSPSEPLEKVCTA